MNSFHIIILANTWHKYLPYVTTVLRKNGLIAGFAKIDFFPEKTFTKFKYCLRKIGALYKAKLSRYDSK